MARKQAILFAITSDHHTGSTVGLCPEEGTKLDDGGTYHLSKAQQWLWSCWEDYWSTVNVLKREHRAKVVAVFNGDLAEGVHHGSSQTVSTNPETLDYIADRAFERPKALADQVFVVRGTEAHAGSSGSTEEGLARRLNATRDPATRNWSWWELRLLAHGQLFEFKHHGRMGLRPWTAPNVVALLAASIFFEHSRKRAQMEHIEPERAREFRHPDFAIRSHRHQFADSYHAHPTRVIQTPAWQLKTSFGHKVAAESLADVGGVSILVEPSGSVQVWPKLYTPSIPPPLEIL